MNGMKKSNNMSKLEWTIKLIIIVVGSVVAAYGITLALYAGFGGATLAVLWQGISKTFHVSIGTASHQIELPTVAQLLWTNLKPLRYNFEKVPD